MRYLTGTRLGLLFWCIVTLIVVWAFRNDLSPNQFILTAALVMGTGIFVGHLIDGD